MSDQDPQPDSTNPYLLPMLRALPYFRGMLRAAEARYYQDFKLPSPVLDVGAGDGHFASVTFERKLDVGLDPWLPSLREAKGWGAYKGLVAAEGAKAPFPAGYFASALSNSVLEHIPGIDAVLAETARLLRPGAPFLFCVPNPRYFTYLGVPRLLPFLRRPYAAWFKRISRVHHADDVDVWQQRLEAAGFTLERWWHYFAPSAMRALDWGHYLGVPSVLPRALVGRWLFTAAEWNVAPTVRRTARHAVIEPHDEGAFTFFVCRRV